MSDPLPRSTLAFEAAEPDLRPRDLLVAVKAVSLNPVDTKVRSSRQPDQPSILGYDAAVYDGAWEEWSRKAELPIIGPAKP